MRRSFAVSARAIALSLSHFRLISSLLTRAFSVPSVVPFQGLDKFTTALVTRVEAREGGGGGSSTLRTRVRVEAALFGVQRTHTRLNLSIYALNMPLNVRESMPPESTPLIV
jgi:hypothetical protein